MEKIKRMSLFLKYVFWLILILIPITDFFGWMYLNGVGDFFIRPEGLGSFYMAPEIVGIQLSGKMLGFAASLPLVLLEIFSMWQMIKLFTLYSEGKIFTVDNINCFSRAAWAFLLSELVSPIVQIGTTYAATMHNIIGHRVISVSIDDTNLGGILLAGVVLAISWVMDEGRKLNEDAELTV
ncbi:DUF2975 domain-containing protein [Desulfovibrio gilichinskyi]|uniref:DUF2975 domain-containing protein n=1 Tax=Desulfovibrio gilichinskyi TaxID=1519643 RepID=A0A1X7DFY8_9BACT|nr:DUF2975 domain-containing protein [Desulfovibrio gilichinskyi]SMF14883.1 Protein of unknown function [Desulfovibrio gilichinskyi]